MSARAAFDGISPDFRRTCEVTSNLLNRTIRVAMANGRTLGTFSPETQRNGIPERGLSGSIRLFDERGREIWRSPTRGIFPATE